MIHLAAADGGLGGTGIDSGGGQQAMVATGPYAHSEAAVGDGDAANMYVDSELEHFRRTVLTVHNTHLR